MLRRNLCRMEHYYLYICIGILLYIPNPQVKRKIVAQLIGRKTISLKVAVSRAARGNFYRWILKPFRQKILLISHTHG